MYKFSFLKFTIALLYRIFRFFSSVPKEVSRKRAKTGRFYCNFPKNWYNKSKEREILFERVRNIKNGWVRRP